MVHLPSRLSGTAVLIVPPFGWQEVCSYRALRTWAEALADAGHAAARLTLPGTGDSAGDAAGGADMVSDWCAAIGDAARQLQERFSPRRLVILGIGLGGLLAVRALAGSAPVDELILWDVPSRGRTLVREMIGHSRIIAAEFPEDERDVAAGPETVELTGYGIGADTVATL
ncbi:MAG: hypothetical protein WBQ18_14925, partial [Solirubrobacteraceae bacterium]